ncbi:PAS domain S-box-containing protein [Arcicella aurantiaca]|uniref:histidine kinase n=1 Tax=Arcicella aurantiaca TaxID=591202 RepID=A0A316E6J4_9BACT|nr:hybrid sensor histidine kinase/response regulator [Arcicella aurantiaca]PWK25162.1 PAS domain S-box-containing protein [Arcicella aurantiaca]
MFKGRTIKILLVDDDEDDFFLTSEYIKEIKGQKFEIDWAYSFDNALQKIKEKQYDLCFFDFLLGAKTGLDLLKTGTENGLQAPVILLTGKGDKNIDMEAMILGAFDYLVKSELDAEKLERCIRYSLDRANTLATLRESERKYRNIFAQTKEAIFATQLDGTFRYFTPATAELLGYTEEELIRKKSYTTFVRSDERLRFIMMLEKQGEISNYEVELVTKFGERKQCSIHCNRQLDSEGVPYYLGIIHDITSRKKDERDSLLFEKMAATGRLVRTLAHEVRNPLTNINLSLDQMGEDFEDEDAQFFMDIIRRNSQRINDLITELLNTSKPSEVIFSRHDLTEVLETTIEQAIDRINLKGIHLKKNFTPDIWLDLDKSKIQIAFLNIIINAVEAMKEGEGVLEISTSFNNKSVIITIKDNGIGISQEHVGRLFEPYFTSKNNGIGLGLAATLNIIQSHKARVEVDSELNKGTVFTITFSRVV